MAARTVVITGASDGIGAAAARRLAAGGDTVVVVGRSASKTAAVASEIGADYFLADFTELSRVRELAEKLLERYPRIEVLANNAGGIMGKERQVTVDGHERTFQVNHLAPFYLTTLLMDRLLESHARVINTSSVGNRIFSDLDIDDLEATRSYKQTTAYGNGKLDNILFTHELHRRYHDRGLRAAAFHPGGVATNFSSESGSFGMRLVYFTPLKHVVLITPEKGANDLVWLATATPGADWQSGEYYYKYKVGKTHAKANDPELARQLWDRSESMIASLV